MKIEATIDVVYSVWGADDQIFSGGVQPVEITPELAPALAGAVASGIVKLVDPSDEVHAALDGFVESQEDSEAALDAAVESGEWREGHLEQWIAETEQRLALSNEDANLNEGERDFLSKGVDAAFIELTDLNPEAADAVSDLVARQAESAAAAAGEEA